MNLGSMLIIASLVISAVALIFLIRSAKGNTFALVTSQRLYYLTTMLIFFSLVLLLTYFLNHKYEFLYVYNNSSSDLPTAYLVAAVWAGKEGSFLLWLFMLNILGIIIIKRNDEYENILMSVIVLTQVFMLIALVIESPFIYIWDKYPENFKPGMFPGDGAGMNPLLIDPWMVTHPPMLFLGYASSTIPFAYAVAALVKGDFTSWVKKSYPWVIFTVVFLGIGIFLGGYWAYKVLGWGGYWGWDPVENSSLIPWLFAVALMHGMILQMRNGIHVRRNLLMALACFILVFISTYLTRSDFLKNFSVHSFGGSIASSYLLSYIIFFFIVSISLFFWRMKSIESKETGSDLFDWRTITSFGIIVLAIYSLLIFAGTVAPKVTSFFMKNPSSVNVSYYNNITLFLGIIILSFIMLSTSLTSKDKIISVPVISAMLISLVLGILFNIAFTANPAAYIFTILSLFLVILNIIDLYRMKAASILASRLTHIGVGLMVIGIIASNFHSTNVRKRIEKDKEYDFGSFTLIFKGVMEEKQSSLKFTIKDGESKDFKTAYYFDNRTNSLYREPFISMDISGDTYITPDDYHSGMSSVTTGLLKKGDEKEIGGIKIKFLEFATRHMTSGEPSIFAELTANGRPVKPGLKFIKGETHSIDAAIPGTKRKISLLEVNASSKTVFLHVSPDEKTVIPPDTVVVDVSHKRMIWVVWLGTIIIAAGGFAALIKSSRKG